MVHTVDLKDIQTTFFSNEQNADKPSRSQGRRSCQFGSADQQRGIGSA